jgi:ribosomal protein S18 acetylase RimI-like enzyme
MRIRPASPADAAELTRMIEALAAHEGSDTTDLPGGGTTLVAVKHGKPVGRITVYPPILGVAEIRALWVDERHRRQGIGRKLLLAAIRRAGTEISFTVAEGNSLALAFYDGMNCRFAPGDQPGEPMDRSERDILDHGRHRC